MWRLSPRTAAGLLVLLSITASCSVSAQKDSLVLTNGDAIVGEVESMSRDVLTMSTDYSDSDFKIDWDEVRQIFTGTYYVVILTDDRNSYGKLSTGPDLRVSIVTDTRHYVSGIGEENLW